MQGFCFCEMNGYWRYILGEISKLISPPEKKFTPAAKEAAKEAFETKLMKWLTITDAIQGAIRTTCTIDPMSHVGDMGLASKMWKNRIVVSRHRIYRARLYIYPSPHRNALGL